MPIVISGDPKGKNFLYANGNSVLIRDIAVSSESIVQARDRLGIGAHCVITMGLFCLWIKDAKRPFFAKLVTICS